MTFAEILINTMTDKSEAVNFFDYLFYAKQYCMILESIEGESINSFSPEQLRELEIGFTNVYSPGQLIPLQAAFVKTYFYRAKFIGAQHLGPGGLQTLHGIMPRVPVTVIRTNGNYRKPRLGLF